MMHTKYRDDTPHCKDKIFLNSAGASLVPEVVRHTVIEYLNEEAQYGGYKLAELKKERLEHFYSNAGKLLNCGNHNIAFAHDATDAYTKALSSLQFAEGDVIITTDDDYVSNQIQFIQLQQKLGIKIQRIRNLANGDLDIAHFESLIHKQRPTLVAITHIPTNSGLIQDVAAIGNICAKQEICYLLDACQSVGQIPVDVQNIKCDYLSVTGRKFLRGPRGTGVLYVSDRMLKLGATPQFADLHGAEWTGANSFQTISSAQRFQYWETPCALVLGLSAAMEYALNIGLAEIQKINAKLIRSLSSNLDKLPDIQQLDKGSMRGSILSFTSKSRSLQQLSDVLDRNNIYYSIAHKSSALLDFEKKKVDWAIRLSPHYFNTIDEMDRMQSILSE